MSDPAATVAAIEARATIHRTPCGAGTMRWHVWGAGPPLALFHGGFGSWTHWLRNVVPLGERYRVLAPDLPGLGDSDPPPAPYSADSIAAIVASGLETLLGPDERLDIAGFSFGGLIGGHVAERLGARAKHLVLVGSGGLGIPRGTTIELVSWRELPTAAAQRAAHRRNLEILMIADPANIDDLAIHLQSLNAARGRLKSRPLSRIASLRTALPRVAAQLHGIWGERDITAEGTLEEHARLLRSIQPGARFIVIERAGHWVQYEAAPRFNTALVDLLAG